MSERCFRWMGILLLTGCAVSSPENSDRESPAFPPIPDSRIARYEAFRAAGPIRVDGRLDEPSWEHANRTSRFVDLISGKRTLHDTRGAILWDERYLYVGFWAEEPDVHAEYTVGDSPIYRENDLEIFIAAENAYYEFEINALGTIYDVFFIWQQEYETAGFSRIPEFDRSRTDVISQAFDGVGFKNHPRGPRWAFIEWDFPGIRSSIFIDGTLNDDSDLDRGWRAEIAVPWSEMWRLMPGDPRSLPPRDGDVWRISLSRFNRYRAPPPASDSGGWAWSPHGAWDSHIPECFPYVTFVDRPVRETAR